ncbi:rab-3-interacting molecule unc-10-like isoform X2 [Folsomia candida]|uniref:rab-3-interacting molecule unc-10-like isoform X2 n=1 Tax=Folsomia candida TaxID=158441 RepID=UPI001604B71B|nr:rab-3-interacting molecule unc-10-like isoform X2 [Folsomia candida]
MASTSHVTSDLPPMPDLSHLTEEEKQIIHQVMLRQQQEEEKEHEIVRRKADEVKVLEDTIRQRSSERKAGSGLDATCQLCLKTKFADGVGHVCAYCGVRCCARCGGKVTLRSNKVIWVCILCRKKQELLIKTGQWMTQPLLVSTPEKENRGFGPGGGRGLHMSSGGSLSRFPPPLVRTSSLQNQGRELPTPQLRRQYSQENRPPQAMVHHQHHHHLQRRGSASSEPQDYYPHHYRDSFSSEYAPPPPPAPSHPPSHYAQHPHIPFYTSSGIGPPPPQPPSSSSDWATPPPRQLPNPNNISSNKALIHPGGSLHHPSSSQTTTSSGRLSVVSSSTTKGGNNSGSGGIGGQRSLSSSEEELRSTPDYTSGDELDPRRPAHHNLGQSSSSHLQQTSVYLHHHNIHQQIHSASPLDPPGGLSSLTKGAFDGAKSFSGSSSSVVLAGGIPLGAGSLGGGGYHRFHHGTAPPPDSRRRGYTDRSRTKKTVRFDSDDFVGVEGGPVVGAEDEWFSWDQSSAERQGSQDSTTKDSGIDTCSNFTSSEDSNRELVHTKHPVSWRPNSDGSKLIGHMILKKDLRDHNSSSAHILGLKVTGGVVMDVKTGRLGAVVEKVKEGSIADIIGRVRPGDEIVEWNGRGLIEKTFDEVHEVIADSKLDPQVEIVVSRHIGPRMSGPPGKSYLSIRKDIRRPSVTVTSPSSPDPTTRISRFGPVDQGKIQLKIWFDPLTHQLTVTVINACDLPSSRHGLPNPFTKLCLLPDRSEKWKRRTRTLQQTRDPNWNQSCIFAPIRLSEIRTRILQATIWDCDRTGKFDYLGEASVELSTHPLDDEAEWHYLTWDRKSSLYIDTETSMMPLTAEHLSPPSTTSRLSDSDTEFDNERRIEIASISSSSSPPPDDLTNDRRSRRDLSPLSRRVTECEPYSSHPPHPRDAMGRRSLSATTQFRSKSPPKRPFSPLRNEISGDFVTTHPPPPRVLRSATATPQGSPKKRQLPIVPPARERMSQEIDERARALKARMRSSLSASSSYSSRGPSIENEAIRPSNRGISPDREWADSDLESVTSAFSTQSENPNRLSEYALRHPKRNLGTRSLSSDTAPEEKADGSLSDTAVNLTPGSLERPRGHRTGGPQTRLMAQNMSGLGKKSSSTSQLSAVSATGRKRRLGFGRSKGGIGIHRSEEILPDELRLAVSQTGSSISSEDMSISQDTSDSGWMPRMTTGQTTAEGGHITDFIEGLGPGQLVGRQVLASPSLGDIQLSLCDRKGNLEVEVIRARSLKAKTGSKITPAPYVKVYLVKGKKCLAKAKTENARRTLDPLYQRQLVFKEKYGGCILQVTVWGDYGRIEGRKIFMGVAQIMLDDLDLSNIVIGWYKLFGTSSLI